jgi:hypothetical protein
MTTITVAVQPNTNVAFGIGDSEATARNDAREWFDGDVATLDVLTIEWTGPVPTEHTAELGRAIDAARAAR